MYRRLLIILTALLASACAQMTERSTGLVDGQLTPCPAWPRCVHSQAEDPAPDPGKQIAPFQLRQPYDEHWPHVVTELAAMPRTTLVEQRDHYVHAEVISPWRFYTDDIELRLNPRSGRVDVRSSGRIGYYDFDVNRDRVNALRSRLQAAELIR